MKFIKINQNPLKSVRADGNDPRGDLLLNLGISVTAANAAYMSTLFDIGGIIGGICAGQVNLKNSKLNQPLFPKFIMIFFSHADFRLHGKIGQHLRGHAYRGNTFSKY